MRGDTNISREFWKHILRWGTKETLWKVTFSGRNKRLATEYANALLPFACILLAGDIVSALAMAGLYLHVGVLHRERPENAETAGGLCPWSRSHKNTARPAAGINQ